MTYRTPAALEMVVKAVAKASPLDTGRAVSGFYFHRFLCRVFSRPDSPFMLKGGLSILARTMDARATRDIDLLSNEADVDAALDELRTLAKTDLGDLVTFEFVRAEPIKVEDEYRSGLNVAFVPLLGGKRMQEISIDLVVDRVACGTPEVVEPADRIEVAGIPTFNYRIYPLASSLADKLCAMVETHSERYSSRVKDLVDVAIYATTVDVDGGELCKQVRIEASARGIALPDKFAAPDEWRRLYDSTFRKLVRQTGLSPKYSEMAVAEALAAALFDPVLAHEVDGRHWNHGCLRWE
ncbi:MAG: nucleotidyl transferase AbiEii/AbiGii toxin family protein [Gordonibacter sp.]